MADDDGSRRPPQAYTTVSPVGVGTTTTNRVSPETIQEILNTGDQSRIDQAWEQLTVEDMTRYLESLPSLPDVGGRGRHVCQMQTPSTGARTPHRGSPLLSSGARTPHRGSPRLSPGGLGRANTPRGRQPSPSLPWSRPSSSQQVTPQGSPRTLNQVDLQRRLRMLLRNQEQFAQGHEIANITTTNSIVTSCKQGGRPTVQSTLSRFSS